MSNKRNVLIRYGISILAGGLFAFLYILPREFGSQDLVNRYRILCDAFTIPGVLMLCFGGLILASNAGGLDGVTYGLTHAVRMLIPGRGAKKQEKYLDYVKRRREKQIKGYGFLFFTGLGFMALALLFLALFYQQYTA